MSLVRLLTLAVTTYASAAGANSALTATWLIPSPVTQSIDSKLCSNVFLKPFQLVSISHKIDQAGQFIPKVESSTEWNRPLAYDEVSGKILKAWDAIHGYTSADNLAMLARRDQNLDPMRTSYFLFENQSHQNVGIRVFDASDIILKNEVPWLEVQSDSSVAPLEQSKPGFQLPFRNSGKPFYAWELGLLNADPALRRGTEYSFTNVASRLDHDYNGGDFIFFGRTQKVQATNMMIYAQTRAHQVSFFEQYGLKPITEKNLNGEQVPIEVTPGMILVGATAKDFIEINFSKRVFTSGKSENSRLDEAQMKEQIRQNQAYLSYLDKNILSDMNMKDIVEVERKLIQVIRSASQDPMNSQTQGERLAAMLSTYFRIVNSVPAPWRSSDWQNLRKTILYSLTQTSPQLAYYYLYIHLRQATGGNFELAFTPQAEADFFKRFPIPSALPLGIKAEVYRQGPL